MADNALWLNGREVSALGLRVIAFDGLFGGQQYTYPNEVLPGRTGVLSGAPHLVGSKELVVYGRAEAASVAALPGVIAAIQYACGSGALVEIRTLHDPSRVLYGRLSRSRFIPPRPQGIQPLADAEIAFTIPSGVSYGRAPLLYTAPEGERLPVPLGRMASAPTITVMAGVADAVNPVVTYRHANGSILRQMTLGVTLVAGQDFVTLNCDDYSVMLSDNGVVSSAPEILVPGPFILLNPQDGDPETAAWPTLEVSAGSLLVAVRRVDPV